MIIAPERSSRPGDTSDRERSAHEFRDDGRTSPATTAILFVRHADVHNPADIIYGRLPRFRLSDLGRRQAAALADAMAGERIEAVYASPMLRARQTARMIADRHRLNVRISSLLHEVRTGFQGASSRLFDRPGWTFYDEPAHPEDETIIAIYERMRAFLERAAMRHRGGSVVAVSHADPIMILKVGLSGVPLNSRTIRGPEYPEKCSIVRCELHPSGWRVRYLPPPV